MRDQILSVLSNRSLSLSIARNPYAPVVELVDALNSKSSTARRVGSIPTGGTTSLQGYDQAETGR